MRVNYYIIKKRPDRFGKVMIYFSMYVKQERLRLFTGLRVDPGNWNNKTNQVGKEEPGHEDINDILRSMENEARDIWLQYRLSFKKYPSFQYMKDNLSFVKKSGNGFLNVTLNK